MNVSPVIKCANLFPPNNYIICGKLFFTIAFGFGHKKKP